MVLWAGLIQFPPQPPYAWETRKTQARKKRREETKEQKFPKITNVLGWIWWRRLFAAVGACWVCARAESGSATLPRSHCSSESEDQSAGKSGWDKRPSGEYTATQSTIWREKINQYKLFAHKKIPITNDLNNLNIRLSKKKQITHNASCRCQSSCLSMP